MHICKLHFSLCIVAGWFYELWGAQKPEWLTMNIHFQLINLQMLQWKGAWLFDCLIFLSVWFALSSNSAQDTIVGGIWNSCHSPVGGEKENMSIYMTWFSLCVCVCACVFIRSQLRLPGSVHYFLGKTKSTINFFIVYPLWTHPENPWHISNNCTSPCPFHIVYYIRCA